MTRRRKTMLTLGLAGVLLLGGAVAAPFASASEVPAGSATVHRSGLQRWIAFWTAKRQATQPIARPPVPPAITHRPPPATTRPAKPPVKAPPVKAPPVKTSPVKTSAAATPRDDNCSDVEFVFARGTGDIPRPLGSVGVPFSRALTSKLSDKTVHAYGVDYAASADQSSAGPGATDMSEHVRDVAAQCSATKFVISGYSQGASVTDIAVAARGAQFLGTGGTIPTSLAGRIAAVVVFGNPLSNFGGTLESASALYGSRTKSFCGSTDSVCGGSRNSNVTGGHLSYTTNGAIDQAATFAAAKVNG
jgi:cutinase